MQEIAAVTASITGHFDNLHSIFGLIGILLVLEALFAGYAIRSKTLNKLAKNPRGMHRISGWTALAWMAVAVVTGIGLVIS